MKETKSITVLPSDENETIDLWADFGWELQSSQEIFNKDSGLKRSGDTIYSVTTTINYVKLVFQRDTSMPNYEEIRKKEAEYARIVDIPLKTGPNFSLLWLIFFLMYGIGIVVFLIIKSKNKKYNESIRPQNEEKERQREKLRSEAQALVFAR